MKTPFPRCNSKTNRQDTITAKISKGRYRLSQNSLYFFLLLCRKYHLSTTNPKYSLKGKFMSSPVGHNAETRGILTSSISVDKGGKRYTQEINAVRDNGKPILVVVSEWFFLLGRFQTSSWGEALVKKNIFCVLARLLEVCL